MSSYRWMTTQLLSGSLRPFLYSSSVFLPPLNIFCFCYSLPFLSFIVTISAWNVPLISPICLRDSVVFPVLFFPSVSLHCSFKMAFLSFLAVVCNSVFNYVYLSRSPLPFTSLLSSGICKASSGNPFCLFAFLFVGDGFGHCLLNDAMNLCLSSGILSTRSTLLNLFVTSTV